MFLDFISKKFIALLSAATVGITAVAAPLSTPSDFEYVDVSSDTFNFDINDDAINAVAMAQSVQSDDDYGTALFSGTKPSWLSDFTTLPAVCINSNVLSPAFQYGNCIDNYSAGRSFSYTYACTPLNNLGFFVSYTEYIHIHSDNGFTKSAPSTYTVPTFTGTNSTFVLDSDHSSDTDLFYYFIYNSSSLVSGKNYDTFVVSSLGPASGRVYCNVYVDVVYSSGVSSVDNSASVTVNGTSGGGSAS